MLDQFITHIREKKLLDHHQRYLLAISGGVDSVVLAHLLKTTAIAFDMAHCNFQLRDEESDGDESLVKTLAKEMGVQVYAKAFDTLNYAEEKGISVQMAARELRYFWFHQLLDEKGYDAMVLAQHADDQLETILMNLMRETGIEGIYGMAERRERIIRPLLIFDKETIIKYAQTEKLTWREDSSNASNKYKRNYIRNELIPILKEGNPDVLTTMLQSFERLKDTGKAFFHFHENWLDQKLKKEGKYQYLEITDLKNTPGRKSLLYYWLRKFGFNYDQVEQLDQSIHNEGSGQSFLSLGFLLNVDRQALILGPIPQELLDHKILKETEVEFRVNDKAYHMMRLRPPFKLDKNSENAMLDQDRLTFPLTLRLWGEGDRFQPLGMKNFKKISDFLIDLKVPLIHKKNIHVLCSGEDIVWVIGLRIDDRFSVTTHTKNILYLKEKSHDQSL